MKKQFSHIKKHTREKARKPKLIGIHSMQGLTATTRHGVKRKRSTKRLKHTGNLFRENLQLKDLY